MNSPTPPITDEVAKQAPPGPNDALVLDHQFPYPDGLTPDESLFPSTIAQTNAILPDVPLATEAWAVMDTAPLNVDPAVGSVMDAVGAGAVTWIVPILRGPVALPLAVLEVMVNAYEPGFVLAGIATEPL